jgi:glycosyltransferase involved in cell wall biosynthesis
MKVSIITVAYNSEKTINQTILSVINQSYQDIEYIIVDGNSSDSTIDIVKSYGDNIAQFISEPDKGIYDAINKGIGMATGEIVGILNSDDELAHTDVIKHVVDLMDKEQVDSVYGDLKYVAPTDNAQVKRYWKSGNYKRNKFLFGWMPPHPTFYVKREVYEKYGNFDLSLSSAADYELMLRFMYKHKISAAYNEEVMVYMKTGGKSNASLLNHLVGNMEDRKAWVKNNLRSLFFTTLIKPFRKLPQFFLARY